LIKADIVHQIKIKQKAIAKYQAMLNKLIEGDATLKN
jgi:hypothetical protein